VNTILLRGLPVRSPDQVYFVQGSKLYQPLVSQSRSRSATNLQISHTEFT